MMPLIAFVTLISGVCSAGVTFHTTWKPMKTAITNTVKRWMSSIRDDATQVGLEFHVDYWDELGWPDPFADARYTARQLRNGGQIDRNAEQMIPCGSSSARMHSIICTAAPLEVP